jgi:hypothetical protein
MNTIQPTRTQERRKPEITAIDRDLDDATCLAELRSLRPSRQLAKRMRAAPHQALQGHNEVAHFEHHREYGQRQGDSLHKVAQDG